MRLVLTQGKYGLLAQVERIPCSSLVFFFFSLHPQATTTVHTGLRRDSGQRATLIIIRQNDLAY